MDKVDIQGILLAHLGNLFLTAWTIWSYEVYGVPGSHLFEFLRWGSGL